MSTLSDKEKRKIAEEMAKALAEAFRSAVISAAFVKALEEKGRPVMEEAKVKLAGMQISPDLMVALDKVTPKDALNGFKLGTKFLRDSDEVWDAVVTKILGKNPFTKRGMSAYFMRYVEAMVRLQKMVDRQKQLDLVLEPNKGNLVAVIMGSKAQSLIDEGLDIISALFGYTSVLSEQIPVKPNTFRQRVGVYVWKNWIKGAVAADYEEVRKVADEFLAGSMNNHRIAQLAYL